MQDLLNDYKVNEKKSIDWAERYAKRLEKYFRGCKAKDIKTDHINQYIAERKKELAANGTINRELSLLKRAYSIAIKSEKILRAPYIPKLAENNVRPFFFEHEDYLKLKEALPDHLKALVMLAYHSGMRREEMLSLTWDKVDLIRGQITLAAGSTKNKDARIIPLRGELLEALMNKRKDSEENFPVCPYIFHYRGQRIRDTREGWNTALKKSGFLSLNKCRVCGVITESPAGTNQRQQMREKVDGLTVKRRKRKEALKCRECGSDKLRRCSMTMHDFRRSAVRNMVRSGVPETICMKLSGHKTRSIFDRYNIVNEADLVTATERIQEYHRKMEDQDKRRTEYKRTDIVEIGDKKEDRKRTGIEVSNYTQENKTERKSKNTNETT